MYVLCVGIVMAFLCGREVWERQVSGKREVMCGEEGDVWWEGGGDVWWEGGG